MKRVLESCTLSKTLNPQPSLRREKTVSTKKHTTKPARTKREREEAASKLASHIAAILNDPNTPTEVYNQLAEGVCQLTVPSGFWDREEYLRVCILGALEAEGGKR